MADIPKYPDENDLDNAREFRSIQKDISDYYKSDFEFIKKSKFLRQSVQEEINANFKDELGYMQNIREQTIIIARELKRSITAQGTSLDDAKRQIKSAKDLVNLNRDLLKISQDKTALTIYEDEQMRAGSERWIHIVKDGLQEIIGLDLKQFSIVTKMGNTLREQGMTSKALAYSIGAFVMMLKGAFELFKSMDKEAWNFRKAMGMTRIESQFISKDAQSLAIDYMAMGVTIEGMYKSYQAIGQAVGGVHNVTKDMARDVALMSAQLGISEDVSVGFMRNLAAVSKSSMELQTNMMGLAQSMSSAAGVNLGDAMKDVASKSSNTLTLMSRLPNIVLRAAIELRRMGTSMTDAANAGSHVLDFTQSINEEMEASVLLGRGINFQSVRQLTYNRDLEGAAKRTVELAKQNGFLHKMDYFQMQAFAKMSGYSVDQLTNMVQTSEQLEKIRRNGTPRQMEELANYNKMRKEIESSAKIRAADGMIMIRTMANQERITQITTKWNQLLAKAQQFLLPIIDKLLGGVLALVDWAPAIMACIYPLGKSLSLLGGWMTEGRNILSIFTAISSPLEKMGGMFAKIGTWVFRIGIGISKFGGAIGKSLGFLGKFLGFFGEFLGPIGWVIMAFQGISGLIRGWKSAEGGFFSKLFGAIMGGLRGIIPGFDYIVGAFKWLATWAWKIEKFLFLWTNPIGWAIMGFQKFKKLFPETSAAIGDLFGKVWEGFKKIAVAGWEVSKFIFKWFTPLGLFIQGIRLIWPTIKSVFSNAWGAVTGLFSGAGGYIKRIFTGMFSGLTGGLDHLLASIVKGITHLGGQIVSAVTSPFKQAWSAVKSLWGGHSPSQVGLSILQGITSIGGQMHSALTSPFKKGLEFILNKIPGLHKMVDMIHGGMSGAIEKRAQAAYIPAVTVTPNGTQIQTPNGKAASVSKEDKASSQAMSEETGQRMVTLLEKILAKDNSLYVDGSLLSTKLARSIEFKGNYGVNK